MMTQVWYCRGCTKPIKADPKHLVKPKHRCKCPIPRIPPRPVKVIW